MPRYFGFFKEFLFVNYFHNKVTPIIKMYKQILIYSVLHPFIPKLQILQLLTAHSHAAVSKMILLKMNYQFK